MQLTTPLAIDAQRLSKSFSSTDGEISLFKDLNLQIHKGESVAIIGPSGTGKSTLLSLLACLDTPTDGTVSLAGVDLNSMQQQQKAQWRSKNISFVFQSFHLLPELSALENTQLPLDIQGHADSEQQAKHWLEAVGLAPRISHFPAQLSGGEQQRVAIARAFVTAPSLLFADEPTGNLDTKTGDNIIELLFDFSAKTQATLILITHDVHLASRCDRMFNLLEGQLTEVIK
ncbi:MAG: ABC transporter ATP-binding protein [Pseudomonadales bacterium]|nr:ABC transporter ATP-binding protein [Pseudomonadales bacterium]NRA17464.1 ABC transporter ATP-binding protein [Oceanospirillaceae bacterium]